MQNYNNTTEAELERLETKVISYLNSTILQVVNRKTKLDIFKNAKRLKGTKVLVNEHLAKGHREAKEDS